MRTPAASVAHLGQSLHNPALSRHNITLPSTTNYYTFSSPTGRFVQLSEFIGDWFEALPARLEPIGAHTHSRWW